MRLLTEMMSYPFLMRAVIGGMLIALCAALLGVVLVLRRYSMIGDGLSHVSFGSLSIAMAAGWPPLSVSIPLVIAAAFLLLKITESGKMKSDAAIAIISSGSLAVGIAVTAATTGINTDVSGYMFGSILAMTRIDVILSIILSVIVILLFGCFYHKIFAVTFDEAFARATGLPTPLYDSMVAVLTAVTVVLGMRVMGALLISSLIIFPAIISMQRFKTFKAVVVSSAVCGMLCFLGGLICSYLYSIPAGASVVLLNLGLFFAVQCLGGLKRILNQLKYPNIFSRK